MPTTPRKSQTVVAAAAAITCPLSKAVMADPVTASDGHVYDRSALAKYLTNWANNDIKNNTMPPSPVTGKPLTDTAAALQACPVAAAAVAVWIASASAAQQPPSSQAAAAATAPTYQGQQQVAPPCIEAPRLDQAAELTDGDLASVGLGSGDFDTNLTVPTLVAVAQRNAGKSALLEALVGIPLLPRGAPTRVTVRVVLQRGPVVDPYMRVAPIGTAPVVLPDPRTATSSLPPWRRIPAAILTEHDRLPDVVRHVMEGLAPTTTTTDGTEHRFVTDREIQLVVQTPTAAPLQLLDLPGLIGEGNPGHEAVKTLLKLAITVEGVKATSRFLWAHSALEQSANSSVGALLRECGVMDRTTGVLTNCDRVRNDDPDVADVTGIAALLRDDAASHSRAVGGGWHAVANSLAPDEAPATRLRSMPQREAATLKRLSTPPPAEHTTDEERMRFDEDVAFVAGRWGMDRLRRHEQAAYDAFVAEHWDPHMRRCILRRLEEEHMRVASLGVPFAVPTNPEKDGAVDADFEAVRRFVSARAEELPLAATLLAEGACESPGEIAAAIAGRLEQCVQQFKLSAAGDSALLSAHRELDATMRRLAEIDRVFSGACAEYLAIKHAKALACDLEAAAAQYQAALRAFIEDDGDAGLVGSFMRLTRRPDGPVAAVSADGATGTGHTLVLQLHRFEGALACFERLLRERARQIDVSALTLPFAFSADANNLFEVFGNVEADGPITVRCSVRTALVQYASRSHWRAAVAACNALSGAVEALESVTEEAESVTRQRLVLFRCCARLCQLHDGTSPCVGKQQADGPTLTHALPQYTHLSGRWYQHRKPLVGLETKHFRLPSIPDGMCATFSALETVELSGFKADEIGADFCAGCPSLTTVRIAAPQRRVRSIGARFLADCPALVTTDLSGLTGLEIVGAYCLAHCPKLSTVDITVFSATVVTLGSHFLGGSCATRLPSSTASLRWPKLQDLNLRGFNGAVAQTMPAKLTVATRTRTSCPNVDVDDGDCGLSAVLAGLAATAPLTKLRLSCCSVTDAAIAVVAQHCSQLQHLDVSDISGKVTDASIAAVAQRCPQLQHLNVSDTGGKVTDASIVAVAEHCPQLQVLDVSDTKGRVTDASIAAVAQHCPQLRYLNVSRTEGKVTDSSIAEVAEHCPQLQYLNVSSTHGKVTDESITAVAQQCPQLQHLNVYWTRGKVTDVSIVAVAEHCPQLQHLNVRRTCGKVTDASIVAVAEHCPQLQVLAVNDTKGAVTDASIAAVAERCPQLQHLAVSGTDGKVTDASIAAVAEHCANCRIAR